jgi:hypothetical protein
MAEQKGGFFQVQWAYLMADVHNTSIGHLSVQTPFERRRIRVSASIIRGECDERHLKEYQSYGL